MAGKVRAGDIKIGELYSFHVGESICSYFNIRDGYRGFLFIKIEEINPELNRVYGDIFDDKGMKVEASSVNQNYASIDELREHIGGIEGVYSVKFSDTKVCRVNKNQSIKQMITDAKQRI